MLLIDRSYFDGPLLLQVDTPELGLAVDAAIAYWQRDYLQRVLGPSLAAAFEYGIANPTGGAFSSAFSDAFNVGDIAQRWMWIRDGHTFTYGTRSYIWPGFVNDLKQSPIANWTYWKYRKENHTITTGVGEVLPSTENSSVVTPSYKLLRAWDQMVEWNRLLWGLVSVSVDTVGNPLYPELVTCEVDRTLFEKAYAF